MGVLYIEQVKFYPLWPHYARMPGLGYYAGIYASIMWTGLMALLYTHFAGATSEVNGSSSFTVLASHDQLFSKISL